MFSKWMGFIKAQKPNLLCVWREGKSGKRAALEPQFHEVDV